jgi:hypothetical protein
LTRSVCCPLSTGRLCQPPNARQQTTCPFPLSTNHYQCHDSAVTVRSVSSCLAKIDITDDLSALVVQSGTLCHRKRHLLYNLDTSLWIVRRTYCITMAADRPPHAAHTVGNGALQVSRTNSGIRSLPVLVSAGLLVPHPRTRSLGHCNAPGTVPVRRAPSAGLLVHMHLVLKSD